jgi:hypothetical protein
VFGYRVAGAVVAATCVVASVLGADVALAQYEPVGKPLQLVPQLYSSKSAATPRSRVSARKAARSESRSESRAESRSASQSEAAADTRTQQHVSLRRKHRPRTEVAEQRRPQRPAVAASAETSAPTAAPATPRPAQAAPAPASAPAAAPAATTTPAPAPQPNPVAAAPKNELVVGGQTVQVRSPNEANELDLAANEPSTTSTAPANDPALSRGGAPLYNLAATAPPAENDAAPAASTAPPAIAAPAIEPPPAEAAKPKSAIGSAFWFMQIMAALGGAAAAGSAAWFLIGSASPRIRVTEGADDAA